MKHAHKGRAKKISSKSSSLQQGINVNFLKRNSGGSNVSSFQTFSIMTNDFLSLLFAQVMSFSSIFVHIYQKS